MNELITQQEVRRLFSYNPDTGILTQKIKTNNRVNVGDEAGDISPSTGYRRVCINRKRYSVHRIIWLYVYGHMPTSVIDHINMIRDDNRIENLRLATHSENHWNIGKYKNNTTGFKGVTWCKTNKKFKSQIRIKGKTFNLGSFDDPELAAKAYQDFALKHHGDFYCNDGSGVKS